MVIYKITNIVTEKVYIGQTTRDAQVRFNEHMRASENDYFHSSIKHYGPDKFKLDVIDTATSEEELNSKECYWIDQYHSDVMGYNMKPGGFYNPMNVDVIKEHHASVMRSKQVRDKISATMKERISKNGFSEQHRKRISESMKGNQHFKGHKRTASAIEASAKSLRKAVYCVDDSGRIVKEFVSVKAATDWWNIDVAYETKCDYIKKSFIHNKSYAGLKWIYK